MRFSSIVLCDFFSQTFKAVVRGAALQAAISSPSFRVRDFAIIDKALYAIDLHWKAASSGKRQYWIIE